MVVNDRRISQEQAELYAAEGAYQIGIDDPIDDALDQTTEIVRADLLMTARRSGTTRIVWQKSCSTAASRRSPRSPSKTGMNYSMHTKPLNVLVMAAGLGTRMKSNRAKVLHELGGSPLIAHVVRAAQALESASDSRDRGPSGGRSRTRRAR